MASVIDCARARSIEPSTSCVGPAAEPVEMLAHRGPVALQLENVEAAFENVVGELAAQPGDRIERTRLALVEDHVVISVSSTINPLRSAGSASCGS